MNTTVTFAETLEITQRTIEKIKAYPARLGKTVDNYFDLLYPDMLWQYVQAREINRQSGFYKRE